MKQFLKTLNVGMKGIILLLRPGTWLGFLSHPSLFFYNVLGLSKFIAEQKDKTILNDFYTAKRDHARRHTLYQSVIDRHGLKDLAIDYLEFGVYKGASITWWAKSNTNSGSRFYGFDTFEGLPEDWGAAFKKGSMSANMPVVDDQRIEFVKGLFQDTVPGFLKRVNLQNERRKVIHLDADLFSSTLYALSMLSDYLKPGDIILFDEFNVPNHEYYAMRVFEKTFYRKFQLIGAVNNFYQAAFVVVK